MSARPIAVVVDDGFSPVRTYGRWASAMRSARNLLVDLPWVEWVVVTDRRSGRCSVVKRDDEWVALPTSSDVGVGA